MKTSDLMCTLLCRSCCVRCARITCWRVAARAGRRAYRRPIRSGGRAHQPPRERRRSIGSLLTPRFNLSSATARSGASPSWRAAAR